MGLSCSLEGERAAATVTGEMMAATAGGGTGEVTPAGGDAAASGTWGVDRGSAPTGGIGSKTGHFGGCFSTL